jgi:acyl-CoA-binding protein
MSIELLLTYRNHRNPRLARLRGNHADSFQGKAKYNKWQEQVNAGLSQKDAEAKYIELGNELLKKHDN